MSYITNKLQIYSQPSPSDYHKWQHDSVVCVESDDRHSDRKQTGDEDETVKNVCLIGCENQIHTHI